MRRKPTLGPLACLLFQTRHRAPIVPTMQSSQERHGSKGLPGNDRRNLPTVNHFTAARRAAASQSKQGESPCQRTTTRPSL